MWEHYWSGRGAPWEYDPGPPAEWAQLFAQTPDYRALGLAAGHGHELFRWHFGPMFYRGRLDGSARVLVVGQEGAQDESLAHRSFVGGTGARLQHLLGWLGITRSYLFLNTFVYPIFGQYPDVPTALAQAPSSPIVQHRHAILDQAAPGIELVISVGEAAQASIATWRQAHGGTLPGGSVEVHVVHPGAAPKGGEAAVRASFAAAVKAVAERRQAHTGWLPADPDGEPQPVSSYHLGSAPAPFRDLPLGVPWRLGRGGTSSNRRDGQTAIQLFSAAGHYDNEGDAVSYVGHADGSKEGYQQDAGDRPWEPPRADSGAFDRGPGAAWAKLAMGGQTGLPWPDFTTLGIAAHPSFGYGPVLRGRPDAARVLVLADQHGRDDLFSGRALSGDAGQLLQGWLGAAGLTTSYAIARVVPVDSAAPNAIPTQAADDVKLIALHQALIDKMTRVAALVALGPLAQRLAAHIAGARPVIALRAQGSTGWQNDWQQGLAQLNALTFTRDAAAHVWDGRRSQIARADLPYGTLRWQSSSGDRALGATVAGQPSPDYVKLIMPAWTRSLAP